MWLLSRLSTEFPAYTLEELAEHPDIMTMLAIMEMRGYASARDTFDREDGAKNVPTYWQDIIMAVREANMNEDREREDHAPDG